MSEQTPAYAVAQAYRQTNTRNDAVKMVAKAYPLEHEAVLACMWDAIDAYVDTVPTKPEVARYQKATRKWRAAMIELGFAMDEVERTLPEGKSDE